DAGNPSRESRPLDRGRAVHGERAGARQHRGPSDRRRAATSIRARIRGVDACRLASSRSARTRQGPDRASPRGLYRGRIDARPEWRPGAWLEIGVVDALNTTQRRMGCYGGLMKKLVLAVPVLALALGGSTACATKKFVKGQVGEV